MWGKALGQAISWLVQSRWVWVEIWNAAARSSLVESSWGLCQSPWRLP